VDELEARLEAALRREALGGTVPRPPEKAVQRIGELVIDEARCQATLGGETLQLTPTEYRLLCALATRPDEVLSRQELAEGVWGYYDTGVGCSLEVHMRRLRAKLDAGGGSAPGIVTVRGFGYRLAGEPTGEAAALRRA